MVTANKIPTIKRIFFKKKQTKEIRMQRTRARTNGTHKISHNRQRTDAQTAKGSRSRNVTVQLFHQRRVTMTAHHLHRSNVISVV